MRVTERAVCCRGQSNRHQWVEPPCANSLILVHILTLTKTWPFRGERVGTSSFIRGALKTVCGIKKKRAEKNKIRGLDAQQLKLSDRSLSTSALQSSLTMDKYASHPPLKKADWTTHSVASIFQPLDVEKAQLKDSMHSTYDRNFGARLAPKKKLVGGYFVAVDTNRPID